ncbi:hypothetical protein CVT25_010794 [Psilocybe cyanescens]|uniref:Clr5 domain-containing protein n=1 Tax=Psilocybe cyanescens TaxID=93625 RepID=A0A409WF88_PSICY|nr:hypothetical protein CVT25_010794 [Psilocybe cyanescens]
MPATNVTASSSKQPSGSKEKGKIHNKTGKNQYKDRPLLDDPHVSELLNAYHLKGITDNRVISKLLLEEHGVMLGERSVYRRKKMLGLWASKHTTQELSEAVKRQLVAAQMAKDPNGRLGARVVKQRVFEDTGLHLTRDYIRAEMKRIDPAAHAARGPAHILAKRQQRPSQTEATSTEPAPEPTPTSTTTTVTTHIPTEQPLNVNDSSTNRQSCSHGVEHSVRSPRRRPPRGPARVTEASFLPVILHPSGNAVLSSSGSQPQSYLQTEHAPPSGLSTLTINSSSTSVFRPFSVPNTNAHAPTPQNSTPSGTGVQQTSHPQPLLLVRRSTPPPHSTTSFSLRNAMDTDEHDSWPDDGGSEDGLFSPIATTPVGHTDEGAGNTPTEAQSPTARRSTMTTASATPPARPMLPPPPHPPASASTPSNLNSRTSAAMQNIVRAVQETAPKMQELTRYIESLRLEDADADADADAAGGRGLSLSAEAYDVVIRGMETAALLERQLSRIVALGGRRRAGAAVSGAA